MLVPDFWGSIGTRAYVPPHGAAKLITGPTVEPLSLADAKGHCRIDISDDDGRVAQWIRAARAKVEQDTQRALLTQTWDLMLDRVPPSWVIELPYPPLQSVTSVNATDTAGVETVWPSTNYIVDVASTPGRLGLTDSGTWPSSLRRFAPIRIRYVAGWTDPELIPADLVAGLALVIGWLSENRQPAPFEYECYERFIQPYAIFTAA